MYTSNRSVEIFNGKQDVFRIGPNHYQDDKCL